MRAEILSRQAINNNNRVYRTEYKIKHATVNIHKKNRRQRFREDFPTQFHIPHFAFRLKAFLEREKKITKTKTKINKQQFSHEYRYPCASKKDKKY